MQASIRSVIDELERRGELVRVRDSLSPVDEVAALERELNLADGPACLMERVGDSSFPLLVNLWGNRRRIASVLGMDPEDLWHEWNRRIYTPNAPVPYAGPAPAPCQEVVSDGDLSTLPLCRWNARERPYLTFAVAIYRDPLLDKWNAGVYRAMQLDNESMTLKFAPHRPLAKLWREYEAREEPLPVALVLGAPPALQFAASAPLAPEIDEYGAAGGLQGSPLELVKCTLSDLQVPALSEIVLEGELVPGRREPEGPFGDYFGIYDTVELAPCWRVRAITHRREAVAQGINSSFPPNENSFFEVISIETELVRAMGDEPIRGFRFWESSCRTAGILGLSQPVSPGEGRRLGLAALATPQGRYLKTITVVGSDVNINADHEVYWAMATRFDPAHDVHVVPDASTTKFDPAVDPLRREAGEFRIGKLVIDTTRHRVEMERALPDEAASARVRDRFGALLGLIPGGA